MYTGPMASSKTSQMLMSLERFKYQGRHAAVFKPKIDTRYNDTHVETHMGWRWPAITIDRGKDMIEHLMNMNNPDVVAVDEAFMIKGIADNLIWLFRQGVTVVVSSLDISANGKPFDEVTKMLPWATQVFKCAAVCTICGQDARYTHRRQVSDDEIQVGGLDLYEPRCFEHHLVINEGKQT